MAEYIEREKAKEELLSWAVCINHPEHLLREDAMCVIDNIPAADVEPVVRCGECARRYTELCALYAGQMNGKDYFIQQGDDFFCKKGQRLNDKFGGNTITVPKWRYERDKVCEIKRR